MAGPQKTSLFGRLRLLFGRSRLLPGAALAAALFGACLLFGCSANEVSKIATASPTQSIVTGQTESRLGTTDLQETTEKTAENRNENESEVTIEIDMGTEMDIGAQAPFSHTPFSVTIPEGFQISEPTRELELELENTQTGRHILFIADPSAEFSMTLSEYADWIWEDLEEGESPLPLAVSTRDGALLAYYIREDFSVEGEPHVSHWYLFAAGDYYVVCAETARSADAEAAKEEMENLLRGLRMR